MTKVVAVCVRDVRANCYFNPIFTNTLGSAIRQFEDEINRPSEENLLYKHPEDFELYELGCFDSETAVFELLERPRQLSTGSSCKKLLEVNDVSGRARGNGFVPVARGFVDAGASVREGE